MATDFVGTGGTCLLPEKYKMPAGKVFGCSKQLLLNKFFDPSTPSIRKGNSGERMKKTKKMEEKKRLMRIVATASLPAVDP